MTQKSALDKSQDQVNQAEQFEDGFLDDNKQQLNTLKGKTELADLSKSVAIPSIESIIKDGKLDDTLFADENELAVFGKWAEKNMFMEVNKSKDYDREKNKDNTIKSNYKLGALTDYEMVLPENLSQVKVSDIPYIVKNINALSFGNDIPAMPTWTSSKEIAVYMETLIQYLIENGNTELSSTYRQLYIKYFGDKKIVNYNYDLKQELQKRYDNVQDVPTQIESDLGSFLKKQLFQSVLEGGTKMLYENMKAPDSKQYRGLMEYMKPFGDAYNKIIRTTIDRDAIFAVEKKFIEELYGQVSKYTDALNNRENYTLPADVVQSKEMLCVSKTMLIHGILDHYGFKNGVNEIDRHIYNTVTLSTGDSYVVDGIDDMPYNWKENLYTNDYNKKLLFTTKDNLSTDDILMSDALNSLPYLMSPTEQDIISLELANKINPYHVWVIISLGYAYETLGTEKDKATAYEYYNKADKTLQKIIKEKKSEYGLEYDFKKIQIAISKGLYETNKNGAYEPAILPVQKQNLIKFLTEQIKIQKGEVANGILNGTMNQASQNFKNNEIFWWEISLEDLQRQ